mgnify:CR=1 FL=1
MEKDIKFLDENIIKPKKVDAFVISVGNFTTGGVGKTPVVAELARHFVDKGERVAIVSRGYGGKLDNKNVNVISDGINLYYKADMAGDEPYWLAVNLNMCAVLTCSNRYKACQYAIKELGVTKIILDDGFQHRKLHRDLNYHHDNELEKSKLDYIEMVLDWGLRKPFYSLGVGLILWFLASCINQGFGLYLRLSFGS